MSSRAVLGWPSVGFYVLLGTHCILGGMLLWGWQRPALDEAFEVLARRDAGTTAEFSPREIRLLQSCWQRHAGFGRALLGKSAVRFLEPTQGGWLSRTSAHLTVAPENDRPTVLSFEGRGAPSDFPLVVKIRGAGAERQLELIAKQPKQIELSPSDLRQPSILNVELIPAQSHAAPAPSWAVRVTSSTAPRETP